jgi:hypothetical protein
LNDWVFASNDAARDSRHVIHGMQRGATAEVGTTMQLDTATTSEKLASDPRLTDYDFWRSLKNLENEIFQFSVSHRPIPIKMLRWRRILIEARTRRGYAG